MAVKKRTGAYAVPTYGKTPVKAAPRGTPAKTTPRVSTGMSAGEAADQVRKNTYRPAGSKSVLDTTPGFTKYTGPGSHSGSYFYTPPAAMPTFDPAPPAWPPGGPGGNGGGGGYGGGGGGGGGAPAIDTASILALMNRHPQTYQYQDYQWQDVDLPDYQAREFYAFDPTRYDQARTGLQQGIAADTATGNQAYADATTELQQYQNPFTNRPYTQNGPMDQAMQRMMQANGVQADQATQNQGVQADAAFGNVLSLLGGAAANNQASSLRALGGDQRRFQESLANQGRNMELGIGMAQARAQEQYQKDKWQYGEEVARLNYQAAMQEAQYNNQGRNQVGQANSQGQNQTAQQNAQMANEFNAGNVQALLQLISSGTAVDPALLQQFFGTAPPAAPAA